MLVSTMPRSAKAGIATQRSTPAYMRCTQRMRGPAAITSGTHSPMITSASAASRTAAARSAAPTISTPGAASCIHAARAASAPISTTFFGGAQPGRSRSATADSRRPELGDQAGDFRVTVPGRRRD